MFYKMLREQGFRAHQAKQIYKYALALVKAVKKNSGSKPILRKLSARIDQYDAKIDLENQLVVLKLRSKEFRIKLLHNKDHVKKFLSRKWYEIMISIDRQGRIWVAIPFRWDYESYKPRDIISLDINLKKVVVYDGRSVRRIDTRFAEALHLKHLAEDVQKRHSYAWRRNRKWLEIIRALHRRSGNIIVDWCRKFAKYIVSKARKTRSAIALEDLEKLCRNCNCGFIADRDTVGAMNIYLKTLKHLAPRSGSWGTRSMTDETRQKSGLSKDEPMTVYINIYKHMKRRTL